MRPSYLLLGIVLTVSCRATPPPTALPQPGGGLGSGENSTGAGSAGGPSKAPLNQAAGNWETIPEAPAMTAGPGDPKAEAVGRHLFINWQATASYDPCAKNWVKHELPNDAHGLRFAKVIGDDAVALMFNNRSRPPLLLHPTATASSEFSVPRSKSGPPIRKAATGALSGWDQYYSAGKWTKIDATNAPTTYAHSAWADAPVGEFRWGGQQGGKVARGGGFFDVKLKRWVVVPTLGGPGERMKAFATWTGTEFLVIGGRTTTKYAFKRSPQSHGSLYNPKTSTWRRVNGGPTQVLAATNLPEHLALMTRDSAEVLNLSTLEWKSVPYPARAFTQNVVAAQGTAAVIADDHVLLLDPKKHEWNRIALPVEMHKRFGRAQLITKHHLIVWGGKSHVGGSNGCENSRPEQNCLPVARTQTSTTGVALQLSPCQG